MESSPEKLSIEKFDTERILRSQIQNAPYNPRVISDQARRRLKQGLKKLGILSPIVWNRRTGNVVSGHQRLSIMDQLVTKAERIDEGKDYRITVTVVDLNDIEEKEANLLFNNPSAQGDFDMDRLTGMLSTPELDIEATGWDKTDMFRIIGHDNILAEQDQKAGADDDLDGPAPAAEALAEMRAQVKAFDERTKARRAEGLSDYFLVMVFPSYSDRLQFTEHLQLDDNRFQSAKDIQAALAAHGWPEEEDEEPEPEKG